VSECTASSNHCASLAKLPTGGLALSWFSGYREGWAYTGAGLALLPSLNSTVWQPLGVRSAENPGIPGIAGFSRQNPVLFVDNSASELLVFGVQQPSRSKEDRDVGSGADPVPNQESLGTMWVTRSTDWGRTFAAVKPFDPYHGSWGRNSLLLGLDGSWLMPVYNESGKTKGHQFEHSAILRKPVGAPVLPLAGWVGAPMNDTSFLVQPSVIRLKPGQPNLRVYYRDRRAQWIYTATSSDDGLSMSTFCHSQRRYAFRA
jgi:predicted neuraminidase